MDTGYCSEAKMIVPPRPGLSETPVLPDTGNEATEECDHTWRLMSVATEGPCAWFPPGLYCDECGEPCPEDQIPEPDFEADEEARWAFRSERWDVV